ncbi:Sensory box histidine kinase/response regulator [Labilithrix luteola]|uniref:histidine kinase n=1 Tax=Labilithrix luteola TaxID=1391654 RepID=A0A0K1QFY1_9BACT|nr:ATP-binding protein [Labilithrix luteola]AKV04681.1 Sensory box histidine kinase/response regulator [Labilithrix luteola]
MSSVPISRETLVSAASATDVEAAWLDRLLLAACEMPVAEGEVAVVAFLVRAVGEIFPTFGVGACLVTPPPRSSSSPDATLPSPGEQRLFKYVPDGEEHRALGVDPTRMFPGFAYERVLEVEPHGTTLHISSDDARVEEHDTPMMHVVRRAALALERGLGLARAHAKATADARELRVLNSHMVQAEKLASLGQIAAGVVHELNNPLTSIVAYTDWLIRKAGPTGDPDSLERLRRIGESSSRILRFTRDLVAYARPSSEVPVPVSIRHVIEQALAFCEHVIAQHGADVERVFGDDVPTVRGMPEQLVQVFVNLFTNACHAMPADGGVLAVSTQLNEERTHVIVFVDDNGHGIATDHLQAIFAPFFTTKVDGRGTGLGLSIVKNIVDNHGAEIRAERSASGGARFVLAFPTAGA